MQQLLTMVTWEGFVDVVRAMAAVATVIVAYRSVLVTRDQFKKQQKRDTNNAYYGTLVRDTGMRRVGDLRDSLMVHIEDHMDYIEEAVSGSVEEVRSRTQTLLDETRSRIVGIRNELLLGARVWGDSELESALGRAFEQVEDDVARVFEAIVVNGKGDTDSVTDSLIKVLEVLKNYDPGLQ